ncbi:unnamed protein product [Plutella xylostella]|uniref:(diamondback moth) hypothetical protein n=1 Tax=Plutella xylostella TaxID=51655 RepID=A0A8S4DUQ3_PLUXY|nr:unnamed protein product [Plutella xylostella]
MYGNYANYYENPTSRIRSFSPTLQYIEIPNANRWRILPLHGDAPTPPASPHADGARGAPARHGGGGAAAVFMEWDKIWAINKKVIDPIAPRYTTIETTPVPVNLKGVNESTLTVPLHPKNENIGTKEVWVAPRLLIDQSDAKLLKEGENTTFIYYGNVMIDKIHKSADGTITSIDGTPNLDNKDFKKTVKVTWLADTAKSPAVETYCVYFDHIISKPLLGKDEDFKQYIGHQTRWEIPMLGEPALASVKQGDIIQIQRRGFFRVDAAPSPPPRRAAAPPRSCCSTCLTDTPRSCPDRLVESTVFIRLLYLNSALLGITVDGTKA